jgi:hypothetical protein
MSAVTTNIGQWFLPFNDDFAAMHNAGAELPCGKNANGRRKAGHVVTII